MNEERTLVLYDAVTAVREEYIEEAARPLRRPALRRLSLAAACLCLLVGGWFFLQSLGVYIALPFPIGGSGTGSRGGQNLAAYHFYAGPVLPLTAEEEGLTADRRVDFDFSLFDPDRGDAGEYADPLRRHSCLVTDSYRLTAGEAGTRTLYYPFISTLTDSADLLPGITVNGEAAETELLIGPGSPSFFSWADAEAQVGTDPLDRALAPLPRPEEKVTVYALSDLHGERGESAGYPTVAFEYTLDMSSSAVVTYGFNGGSNDLQNSAGTRIVAVEAGRRHTAYLLVLGEDLETWSIRGYADGRCETPMESAGATVTRYESTFGEMLTLFWGSYRRPFLEDKLAGRVSTETLVGLTFQLLLERSADLRSAVRTLVWDLEGAFDQVLGQTRVTYLRFTAHIPAGEPGEVEVRLVKLPSFDHGGRDRYRQGFDLAGKLGSRIPCTGLTASITGGEYIRILRQDFGFETEKGALKTTEVVLDPAGEHWFMDVCAAPKGK